MNNLVQRIEQELDQVVAGIFDLMIDVPCLPMIACDMERREVCAKIAYDGALRGRCVVRMDASGAAAYLCAMLGPATELCAELPEDSVSELCNMIAGGWKSLQPAPPGCAAMSPPLVCNSCDARKQRELDVMVMRQYRFGRHSFQLEILLHADDVSALLAA